MIRAVFPVLAIFSPISNDRTITVWPSCVIRSVFYLNNYKVHRRRFASSFWLYFMRNFQAMPRNELYLFLKKRFTTVKPRGRDTSIARRIVISFCTNNVSRYHINTFSLYLRFIRSREIASLRFPIGFFGYSTRVSIFPRF